MAHAELANPIAPAEAHRLSALFASVNPEFARLASSIGLSPLQLVDWLAQPDIADRLAAFAVASESLARLNALGAHAPALATAQALLHSPDPVEQRRISTTLLRAAQPPRSPTQDRRRAPSPASTHTTAPGFPAPSAAPGRDATPRVLESARPDALRPTSDIPAPTRPAAPAPGERNAAAGHHPPEATPPDTSTPHTTRAAHTLHASPDLGPLRPLRRGNTSNPARALLAAAGAPHPSARSP